MKYLGPEARYTIPDRPGESEGPITGITYRDAGVDIDAGAAFVEAIKPLARSTARPGTQASLGAFAGLFDLKAAGFKDPVLVAATDGVGTKLKIASAVGRYATIGIDLVAMCVNDVVTHGAEPLFFLDYLATGRLERDTACEVVRGVAEGCRQAGCALIGGETAELPGSYAPDEYDLAGFAVGAAERGRLLTGERVAAGDVVLGLASSGLHANGFSLVRRLVEESRLSYEAPAPFAARRTLGEVLLEPTRIYVKSCLQAVETGGVKALAHVTGGGLVENLPRVVAPGLGIEIDAAAWPLPPVFRWLKEAAQIAPTELARTFNCGIGMAVVAAADAAGKVQTVLTEAGETVFALGRVVPRKADEPSLRLVGAEETWRS